VELWENRKIGHTIKTGVILGLLCGVFGLLIWKGTFKVRPLPPNIRYLDFYLQRIPAHFYHHRIPPDKEARTATFRQAGSITPGLTGCP
jgi:hypothetical protein